jgi:hypothetical protein
VDDSELDDIQKAGEEDVDFMDEDVARERGDVDDQEQDTADQSLDPSDLPDEHAEEEQQ